MRLFDKKPALRLLQNRLNALNTRMNQSEHDLRMLQLEWHETLDKVGRLMARVAKRAAIDNPTPQDLTAVPPSELSRSDQITAEILERRDKRLNS